MSMLQKGMDGCSSRLRLSCTSFAALAAKSEFLPARGAPSPDLVDNSFLFKDFPDFRSRKIFIIQGLQLKYYK